MIKPFPEERTSVCTVEQIVDVPVPQIREQIVEVAKTIPLDHISERIVVQTEDVSVPQVLKEVVEVKAVKNAPQERISVKIGEQIDDDTVPVDQPGDQVRRSLTDSAQRVDLALDDFVTLLTSSGIPVDGVVPVDGTCISWHQQVQVVTILDRHVACRSDWAALWSLLAKQEDAEVLEGLENIPKESIYERIVEQGGRCSCRAVHAGACRSREDNSAGAHLGAYTDRQCASATDRRARSLSQGN